MYEISENKNTEIINFRNPLRYTPRCLKYSRRHSGNWLCGSENELEIIVV